jgi:nucleotide-binding universal stress UspA family protein
MGLEPGQFATIDLTRLLHETLLKDLDKNTLLHAEQVVQAATEMIALHNPQLTVSKLVKVGKPEKVLLEEAERWGAHCIFLGAHGDHWSVRQMLGSVVSIVARYAKCSVEVVRSRR